MRREKAPPLIAVLAALGAAFFIVPLAGVILRTPWGDAVRSLTSPETLDALRLSIIASASATGVALVLGVPLAWVYARVDFPGRSVLRALTTLPMVLPPVVGGVALLFAFGAQGFAGEALQRVGVSLPFTTAGAVLAETFVAMPFMVVATEAGLRQADRRFEEVAATLGAGPWRRLRTVTLPLVAPAVAAGAALTWARALGEFGATITFAGNLPGSTQTMPLAVYVALERDTDAAVALSLVLLAVSLVVLVALRGRWLGGAR